MTAHPTVRWWHVTGTAGPKPNRSYTCTEYVACLQTRDTLLAAGYRIVRVTYGGRCAAIRALPSLTADDTDDVPTSGVLFE